MSASTATRRARTLLVVALSALTIALSGLALMVFTTQAKLVQRFYAVDPQTGLRVERYDHYDRIIAFWDSYQPLATTLVVATGIAVVAVALVFVALSWMDRARTLRLPRIAAPLLVPLLIGLGLGLLSHQQLDSELVQVHRLVSSTPIHYWSDGLCTSGIEPCSHLVAFDSARTLALVGMALTVLLLVPAGRHAWRAGVSGRRLGTGWSRAAVLCFGVGVVSLAATRGHRGDREQLLVACEADPTPWHDRPTHRHNKTTLELQAVHVVRCDPAAWRDIVGVVGEYQLFVEGTLAELPVGGAVASSVDERLAMAALVTREIFEDLEEGIQRELQIAEIREDEHRPVPVILLYLDTRSSNAALAQALELAQRAGVAEVILLGEAIVERELETVGALESRVYCPLARLRFDPAGQPIEQFRDGGALVSAAVANGPEALAIAL